MNEHQLKDANVLNLVINGLPSILIQDEMNTMEYCEF